MGSPNDTWVILERLLQTFPEPGTNRILHMGCRDGIITYEFLFPYFMGSRIVGVDASEDLIRAARDLPDEDTVHFEVGDVTRDSDAEDIGSMWKKFHIVVCFCCSNWVRNPVKALENMKIFMKGNGECFFAFIGSSPVYDAYHKLAKDPRWAEYMKDYRRYIPFTHYFKDPADEFADWVNDAGFQILFYETQDIVIYRPSLKTLVDHILDVNLFVRDIPEAQQSDFIRECRENLAPKQTKVLSYRIVILLAINVRQRKIRRRRSFDEGENLSTDSSSSSHSSSSSEDSSSEEDAN